MQNAEKGAQWESPALIKDKANELPMGVARQIEREVLSMKDPVTGQGVRSLKVYIFF